MIILEDEKMMFIHIPKCGGTSVSEAFDRVARWNDILVGGTKEGELLHEAWGVRHGIRKHSTARELCRSMGRSSYEGYAKFTIVRDPIDRFVSAYNYSMRHVDLMLPWIVPAVERYGLNEIHDVDAFLSSRFMDDLFDYQEKWADSRFETLTEAQLLDVFKTFLPQHWYIDNDEVKAGRFKILKLEDAANFDVLMREIGVQRLVALGKTNVTDSKRVAVTELSDFALERLFEIYREDFWSFNYPLPERLKNVLSKKQKESMRPGLTHGDSVLANTDFQISTLKWAISERNDRITSLSQAVTERDGQIANLSQAVAERDGQVTSLSQTVTERDGQIASLSQAVTERDGQIASLSHAVTERDGQIASLSQAVAERDGQVTSLSQTVTERDTILTINTRRIEVQQNELSEAKTRIRGMEQSRSWRMTAPYRWLGKLLKTPARRVASTGLLSKLVVAALLLPAAWVFFGGLGAMLRRLQSGGGTFAEVIAGQTVIREKLLSRSRLLRRFVSACFSLATRIQRAGSVKRSLGNFLRIIRAEGMHGIRGRMITTAPGMTGVLLQSGGDNPVELPVLAKEVARRILVADYRVPRPDVSAGERATVGILKDLCALGYEVVFLPNDMVPSPRYENLLTAVGVQVVTRESGFEYSAHYLEKHGSGFGVFYLIRVDVAETLLPITRRVAPDARVIFHAPDLYFLRETREAELRNDPAARERALQTRDRELAMMSRSDRVVVVSPAEIPVLREVLPDTPISVFPVLYAPVIKNPPPYAKRNNIFFLGGFGHPPNVNAVQWFAAEVWPHVRKALPVVEFHIIGAEAPESVIELGKQPGIKVVGFVPELEAVLETLRVGVAPLQYGAGIKGKVAVTMGAGIPCVCTEIAAEGMGIKNDVHAFVENDPVRFAQAVVNLYQEEKTWTRLAKHGQALVEDMFGNAANRASLVQVLDQSQALPISLFNDYCQTAAPVAVPNPDPEVDVDVSIIVPVYNKWNLTRACLTSVIQTSVGCGVTYEVILADDGSKDDTVRAAELFSGLRVVKTPQNLGFLRNCNHAAKQARGRYILLLNNDTIVLPGWLANLYRTIEEDPSIAIVGSKLLYPDGHIQEAGGGLLANADGVSIGRWLWAGERNFPVSRREPLFNIRRETDYISGASILVRKSFWDSVGGFDERYKNAYCEDSDLAMTARAKGLRVVYEPRSEVIHFEHQTYAGQISVDHAHLQEQNRDELIAKWHEVFTRDHLPPGSKWYLVAAHGERTVPAKVRDRRKSGKLNILYFSPFPSHPNNHGNQATIQQFARRFQSLGHKVHFALLQSHMYTPEHEQAMRDTWDTFDIMPNLHPLGANGQPIPFDGWYEEGLGERIRLLVSKYDIDIVFCSYIFQSKMLEFVPDYILKVIDTHDKMGDRYEMLRKNGQPLEFFSCTPEEEGAYLRRADVVVARREEEARYFDSVTGRNTAIVVPHVEEPHFVDRRFESLQHVGIVASANRINLAIVRECLEAIDRKLGGQNCPFTVHVAGQVKDMAEELPASERAVFKRPWVQMHGFVPDIAEFYGDMDVVVSPVTMGTGINVKTVQAMAFGMPLLTTACGSKGIETGEPMHAHGDLDALAGSMFVLNEQPKDLSRLAEISRARFRTFFDEAIRGFVGLCAHPKLQARSSKSHDFSLSENYEQFKKVDLRYEDGVLEYQKVVMQTLLEMASIDNVNGKQVIEIGANGDLSVAKTWFQWSGKRVIVVTPDPELHSGALDEKKIELILRPGEDSGLPDGCCDLIYGCAVLEHIQDYPGFFRECFRLLRPGGTVLLHGGPHWFSRVGHHLFVVNNEMDYRFNGNNPIPDFGHLYLSQKQMDSCLENQGVPVLHREAIIYQVYQSDMLNRASFEDIVKSFQAMPWVRLNISKCGEDPDGNTLKLIQLAQGVNRCSAFPESIYITATKPIYSKCT